ncbi:MAG: hypothetical protein AMXMBFR82_29570 [Candidatus Hydrogenedentota bacterium]
MATKSSGSERGPKSGNDEDDDRDRYDFRGVELTEDQKEEIEEMRDLGDYDGANETENFYKGWNAASDDDYGAEQFSNSPIAAEEQGNTIGA